MLMRAPGELCYPIGKLNYLKDCMQKPLDIKVNQRFKKWTVIKEVQRSEKGLRKFECRCDCGTVSIVHLSNLTATHGSVQCQSCARKCSALKNKKHGLTGSPIHTVWRMMKDRCYNEKSKSYKLYGGRGIRVSDRWHIFSNFLEDMPERPIGYQLDRIDSDGDYSVDNCRWVSLKDNVNNRRNSRANSDKYLYVLKDNLCSDCLVRSKNNWRI